MAYRAANLSGLATNLFFGLLRAALLTALYGTRHSVTGVSLAGAITFTGLTQAVIALLSIFGWWDVMNSVYSGEVGADLLKPLGYLRYWMARDLGRALAALLTRGLTIMVAYSLIFGITLPRGSGGWSALAAALSLSWLVSFSWRFLVNLASFWTPNAQGIGRALFATSWFLSGFIMPLRFFPDWFNAFCHLTPFPAMVNTVVEVYLGVLSPSQLTTALAVQALWAAALLGASHLALHRGVRRLVIQGG
jgi:ABC-2 type transport system permease protein